MLVAMLHDIRAYLEQNNDSTKLALFAASAFAAIVLAFAFTRSPSGGKSRRGRGKRHQRHPPTPPSSPSGSDTDDASEWEQPQQPTSVRRIPKPVPSAEPVDRKLMLLLFRQLMANLHPEQASETNWLFMFPNTEVGPTISVTSDPTVLMVEDPDDGSRKFYLRLITRNEALVELRVRFRGDNAAMMRAISERGMSRNMPDFATWKDVVEEGPDGTIETEFLTDAMTKSLGSDHIVDACMVMPFGFLAYSTGKVPSAVHAPAFRRR